MVIPPLCANASNLAAIFTPSPRRLSFSLMTSPEFIPMRNCSFTDAFSEEFLSFYGFLKLHCTFDSWYRTWKLGKERVSTRIEQAALMFLKQSGKDFLTSSKIFNGPAFISFHMLTVPDDIGGKDYCNLTINLFFRHMRIPMISWMFACWVNPVKPKMWRRAYVAVGMLKLDQKMVRQFKWIYSTAFPIR